MSAASSAQDAQDAPSRHGSLVVADPAYAIKGIVPDLNSTRPAPLSLPEPPHPLAYPSSKSRDPSKWDFKYLFQIGKAYANFYLAGIKNVYANWRTMSAIQKRLNGTTPDTAARYANAQQRISYNEYELLLRTKRDLKKFIPFSLIFAIFGEFTPIAILLFGSKVVPGTCVIPKQVLHDQKKTLEREQTYIEEAAALVIKHGNGDFDKAFEDHAAVRNLYQLDAYRLGLTPSTSLPPIIGNLYFRFRVQPNLARHGDQILSAASLVTREGGFKIKSPQDMFEWGNKYGLHTLRQWTKQSLEKGEEVVNEQMKVKLLRSFETEIKEILTRPNWVETPIKNHCNFGLNSPLFDRHDCRERRRRIEAAVRETQKKQNQRYDEPEEKTSKPRRQSGL